jgi:hypothetical protein
MMTLAKVLPLVVVTGCSFAFVRELDEGKTTPSAPVTCTTSRSMPATDLALGAVLGGLVAAVTYSAVESFNDMYVGECYHAWKPRSSSCHRGGSAPPSGFRTRGGAATRFEHAGWSRSARPSMVRR